MINDIGTQTFHLKHLQNTRLWALPDSEIAYVFNLMMTKPMTSAQVSFAVENIHRRVGFVNYLRAFDFPEDSPEAQILIEASAGSLDESMRIYNLPFKQLLKKFKDNFASSGTTTLPALNLGLAHAVPNPEEPDAEPEPKGKKVKKPSKSKSSKSKSKSKAKIQDVDEDNASDNLETVDAFFSFTPNQEKLTSKQMATEDRTARFVNYETLPHLKELFMLGPKTPLSLITISSQATDFSTLFPLIFTSKLLHINTVVMVDLWEVRDYFTTFSSALLNTPYSVEYLVPVVRKVPRNRLVTPSHVLFAFIVHKNSITNCLDDIKFLLPGSLRPCMKIDGQIDQKGAYNATQMLPLSFWGQFFLDLSLFLNKQDKPFEVLDLSPILYTKIFALASLHTSAQVSPFLSFHTCLVADRVNKPILDSCMSFLVTHFSADTLLTFTQTTATPIVFQNKPLKRHGSDKSSPSKKKQKKHTKIPPDQFDDDDDDILV
jgi:hypothetical protein